MGTLARDRLRDRRSGVSLAGRRRFCRTAAALFALALASCAGDELQASFSPDNPQPPDNGVSLQSVSSGVSVLVTVAVRAGLVEGAPDTDPPPERFLLAGVSRLRATLRYRPELFEFQSFSPGDFFETASPGETVLYGVEAEMEGGLPTGRLFLDISVPRVEMDVVKGNVVTLEFRALDTGVSGLQFEGGFGELWERGGEPVTGVSYYGGRVSVVATTTQ